MEPSYKEESEDRGKIRLAKILVQATEASRCGDNFLICQFPDSRKAVVFLIAYLYDIVFDITPGISGQSLFLQAS